MKPIKLVSFNYRNHIQHAWVSPWVLYGDIDKELFYPTEKATRPTWIVVGQVLHETSKTL